MSQLYKTIPEYILQIAMDAERDRSETGLTTKYNCGSDSIERWSNASSLSSLGHSGIHSATARDLLLQRVAEGCCFSPNAEHGIFAEVLVGSLTGFTTKSSKKKPFGLLNHSISELSREFQELCESFGFEASKPFDLHRQTLMLSEDMFGFGSQTLQELEATFLGIELNRKGLPFSAIEKAYFCDKGKLPDQAGLSPVESSGLIRSAKKRALLTIRNFPKFLNV